MFNSIYHDRWYWTEKNIKETYNRAMALMDTVEWDTHIMEEGALA